MDVNGFIASSGFIYSASIASRGGADTILWDSDPANNVLFLSSLIAATVSFQAASFDAGGPKPMLLRVTVTNGAGDSATGLLGGVVVP